MILRRVIEHVKAQNWTAVALDFVIVVVGVFIGIQVSNWNAARADRAIAADYELRLHDEAQQSLGGLLAWASDYMKPRYETYRSLVARMNAREDDNFTINDAECDVIGAMHDFIAFPSQFPSLEELTASGEFALLRDPDIRKALTSYRLMKEQSRVLVDALNTGVTILPNAYPDYFDAQLTNDSPGRELVYRSCDGAAMMADKAFRIHFADTASRYNQYYNIVVDQERLRVARIHDLLDAKLGLSHGDAE